MNEAMSFLLPALVLLVAGTAALLATHIWKARRRPGSRAGPGSPLYIPCGCGPGCTPCVTAAQELRDLVAPLWPGVSFPQDSEMWQLSWEDLEQLLERGHLPCCASSSSSGSPRPSRSLSESCQAPNGEHPGVGSRCSCLGAVGVTRNRSSLRMHVAKKNLEVKLRAQPTPVRHSQERLVQQEASPHSSESPSGSCHTPDGEESTDSSPCSSSGSTDISGTRSALRMHMAKKSLEVKMGARPAPVRSSQKRVAEQDLSWSGWRLIHSSHSAAVQPEGNTPCSESEKILQRQRELEFPHPRGAPPSQMWPLLAAQLLLRVLCFK